MEGVDSIRRAVHAGVLIARKNAWKVRNAMSSYGLLANATGIQKRLQARPPTITSILFLLTLLVALLQNICDIVDTMFGSVN